MTISKEAIDAAGNAFAEIHEWRMAERNVVRMLEAALPFLPIAGKPDMLRLAVAAVLEADKEFRANMPPEWEGDPLSDEIDGLRRVFSSTLPIAGEGKVKQLEWYKPLGNSTLSRADTILGSYRVWTHFEANGEWFWDGGNGHETAATSEEAAKAAAQSDFETRILSALISSPGKDGGQEVEAYAWAYEGRDSLPGSEWWPRVSLTLVEECAANRKTVRNVRPLYTRHQPTRMTNSADEIWIEPNPPADPHRGQDWSETNSWGQQATKYVRADLSTQPASTALVEAARFLADRLEDFRQKIDDIDDEREFEGHIIPALARLRAALASQSTSREGER